MSSLRLLVNSGLTMILSSKLPMRARSSGIRRSRNCSAPSFTLCDVVHHAAALIEHDHDLDELDIVDEQRHGLRLVVVEDLEVLFREVRDEPSGGVRHGGEERNSLSAGLESRWLLL